MWFFSFLCTVLAQFVYISNHEKLCLGTHLLPLPNGETKQKRGKNHTNPHNSNKRSIKVKMTV